MKRLLRLLAALPLAATPAFAQTMPSLPVNGPMYPGPVLNFAMYHPVCDGVTDNSAKLALAAAAAIKTTGVLYIPACKNAPTASVYKFSSLTTVTAPDAAHNILNIKCDASVQIGFNATAGWVKFSNAGAGGRLNSSGFTDCTVYPYAGQAPGSGYALSFLGVDRPIVRNNWFNYTPISNIAANGIFLDNTITADISHNIFDIAGGAYGVRVVSTSGASNFNRINHNECGRAATACLSVGAGNTANYIENNYMEVNTGIALQDLGIDTQILFNYSNQNSGAYDYDLSGTTGTMFVGNIDDNSLATVAPVRVNGARMVVSNLSFTQAAVPHGPGILLDAASSTASVHDVKFSNVPASGNYYTNSGAASNNVCNIFDSGNNPVSTTQCAVGSLNIAGASPGVSFTGTEGSAQTYEILESGGVLYFKGITTGISAAWRGSDNIDHMHLVSGLWLGAPTGTDKGVGTLNLAGGLYNDGDLFVASTGIYNKGILLASSTPPTIASGGCSSGGGQTIDNPNGTAAFGITIGAATCGSTITLTLPAATHNWVCDAHDITNSANVLDMTGAASTTAVVLTNFARTTGIAANFTPGEKLEVNCSGH